MTSLATLTPSGWVTSDSRRTTPEMLFSAAVQRFPNGQPFALASASREMGTLIDIFRNSANWSAGTGSPTLSNTSGLDSSGLPTSDPVSRTGMPTMLKVVPSGATDSIRMVPANFPSTATAGKLMLWVYVASLPLYGAGETPTGTVTLSVSTDPSATAAAMSWTFNANQLREGWNCLKVVKTTNPTNSGSYSGTLGQPDVGGRDGHFFGITETTNANFAFSNVMTANVRYMAITMNNLVGATLYFDSLWTDFVTRPQVVLGSDQALSASLLTTVVLPLFNSYGWKGYLAAPRRVSNPSYGLVTDWKNQPADSNAMVFAQAAYDAGWDIINHTMNHNALNSYTNSGEIYSEIVAAAAWYKAQGWRRGGEFYASPQSSTSRLAETVIARNTGIVLQRHARKQNTCVTPWGIDNAAHVGAVDLGSGSVGIDVNGMVTFPRIKSYIDMLVRYGDTGFIFWHNLTTLGDTGDGLSTAPGDGLTIAVSNWTLSMNYIRELQHTGTLLVADGLSGFWYGASE